MSILTDCFEQCNKIGREFTDVAPAQQQPAVGNPALVGGCEIASMSLNSCKIPDAPQYSVSATNPTVGALKPTNPDMQVAWTNQSLENQLTRNGPGMTA